MIADWIKELTWQEKVIGGLLLIIMSLIWYIFTPKPASVGEWHQEPSAPEIKGIPKENITPSKVAVYSPIAKSKLDLPPDVQNDKDKYVLSTSKLPTDTHPQDVVTIIDKNTGNTETLVRREPYPWLAAEQSGEFRFDYGMKNGGVKVGRFSLHEDLIQVKALHAGINGSLDTDRTYFAGVGLGYRW